MRRIWIATLLVCLACKDDARPSDAAVELDGGSRDAAVFLDAAVEPADGDLERDYCAPLATLICERAHGCGCGAVVPGGELDTTGCVARWTDKCLTSYAPFLAAVEAQKARVRKAAAVECIAMITARTPTCERPSGLVSFALCAPFVVTDSALGEPCADVPYCAGGDGICAEGTCVPRLGLGEACTNEYACATGLACFEGRCQAPGEASAACAVDAQCVPPLRCVAGSCAALAAEDAACADTSACEQGLACSASVCVATSGACAADAACGNLRACAAPRTCQTRAQLDAPCSTDRTCAAELYCGAEQRCVARPTLNEGCGNGTACATGLACGQDDQGLPTCLGLPGLGQPCALDSQGPFVCAEGLGGVDNVCAALPLGGEACAGNNRCAEGLACDFTAEGSFCVSPKALGEPCQNDVVCGATGHCGPSGTCEADLPDGSPCSAGNECAGICGPDATGGLSCRPAPGEDDPCLFDEDCSAANACRAEPGTQRCVPEICREL